MKQNGKNNLNIFVVLPTVAYRSASDLCCPFSTRAVLVDVEKY